MKPCVSPFSTARPTLAHGPFADQRPPPDFADFGFGQAGASERRIDVQSVGENAVADAARVVVQQIRRHDFEIVVGGVRERASAVAIAQGPDAGNAGAQLIVDHDVPTLVDRDAGLVEAQVVRYSAGGRRRAAHAFR